jgi:peroxiredoxin
MPALQKLHDQLAPKGFMVLGISIDENGKKKVEAFIAKYKIAYPILLDAEENPAWETYKVKVIPAMFLINQQGQIVKQWIGETDLKEVESAAASLLGKNN